MWNRIYSAGKVYLVVSVIVGGFFFCPSVRAEGIRPINNYLPQPLAEKLKIDVELRHRLEVRDNFDFNDSVDDDDAFHLLRTRLNFDLDAFEYLRGFLQLQDSRIWKSEFSNKTPYKDQIDIRQGYVDIRNISGDLLTFRVGRQELSYGNQRLIGGFNWSNVAQSFDAARAIFNTESARIDLFASRKVIIDANNPNEWYDDDNFYGAYGTCNAIDKHTIDLYYLFRDTGRNVAFGPNVGSGKLDESTIGFRVVGKELAGFDYGLESAFQFGDFGSQDIEAYAVVVLLGYTFDVPSSPRLGFEWDHASGDDDPNDGDRETFDNLYPTNHMHYGYMDRASLQNLNNFRFIVSANPIEKLKLQADVHLLYLDETQDSLYNAGRKVARTSATSDVDDHVGTELDLLAKYRFNENLKILAGYSHFFTGDYLKDSGSNDEGDFLYLQTTLSF